MQNLLPIYGGFATTASYCPASISACCTECRQMREGIRHKEVLTRGFTQLLQRRQLRSQSFRHLNQ